MLGVDPDHLADADMDLADSWDTDTNRLARWALTTWTFASGHLPTWVEHASRATRRRRARIDPTPPPGWDEVHVTALRRRDRQLASAETTGVNYSHQWVVEGHWRWQPCGPGRSERRLIWIAPHIKGPDGAPLIDIDHVAKLIR
jgi:hypothetical protein